MKNETDNIKQVKDIIRFMTEEEKQIIKQWCEDWNFHL